ncbi:Acyl-CoA dehydrogenase type 2 domain-containing protein [Peribacillus asahii]|uniref:Acyl-CoA dehydrogenase type 2 domain-containing protein n=1 Tax=Peribacillus asahii TaxID=228899 RepID=A0A3T0KY32_9BACI|nr:acyl-CoA dehydrogenase [Peribacillus asahii]AZV45232.1 Acyl-CoA dehydrogenase type 2 domain-containing protein [Peribacillus asahii]
MGSQTLDNKNMTFEQLLEGAEKIGRLAEQEAKTAEENATISENVINLMKETQISKLMLPKKYGFPQVDFAEFSKIIRKVANYNISAAWLTFLYPLHNSLPAYLPEVEGEKIIQDGGLICDVFAAVGKAEPDGDGGVRVNGKWNFASGVLYSDWIGLGVMMEFPDSTKPEICMPMFHKSEVGIVKNWDTFGLRGSGSNQVVVDNVYIPFERIIRLEQIDKVSRPPMEEYDHDYPYYDVPYFPAFYVGFPSIALGGAERILQEFKTQTEKRIRLVDGVRESESPRSQRVIAEMTTEFHVAEALMDKYIQLLDDSKKLGIEVPRSEFFAIRTKIIKTCTDIAYRSLLTLGGGALYKGGAMELFFRDLMAVATHKTSLYEDSVAAYGKELFGFEGGVRG